jgi:hypothetical protein
MLMPFTERIAVRGIFASALLALAFLALFVSAWIWDESSPSTWVLVGCIGFFSSLLLLGMHGVLFTTFSQTKSHSLRVLNRHDAGQ